MRKFLTKEFLITLIISFLAFEGVEHLLHEFFDIDLANLLSFGGVGTIILFGFKLHIICCAIPAIGTTLYCAHKNHSHCKHNHKGEQNENES